jgi:hypothetical protein
MNLDELFPDTTEVLITFKGKPTWHVFREPTNEEDLEYQKRLGKTQFRRRGKNVDQEQSDQSAGAFLWLYETIIEKVLVKNGDGSRVELSLEERKRHIKPRVKREAIAGFLTDVQVNEEEVLKD